MKIIVKTLKGTNLEIEVKPEDTVSDVKRIIESTQGLNVYPAEQQVLIHQGKILKDDTTMNDNKVSENSYVVIMLSKTKGFTSGASTTTWAPANQAPPTNTVPPVPSTPASAPPHAPATMLASVPASAPTPTATAAPASAVTMSTEVDAYSQAASSLVVGSNLEQTIQQILDMGGGIWEWDTVVHALRAAYNNPERAVEYLYSGIPEHVEAPHVAQAPASGQTASSPVQGPHPVQPAVPSSGPNANPLNIFPQVNVANARYFVFLKFKHNRFILCYFNRVFQIWGQMLVLAALIFYVLVHSSKPLRHWCRLTLKSYSSVLGFSQPMLQELGKQNPLVMRLIQEHQHEFVRLINEPADGGENNLLGQLAAAMPQAPAFTPEERESIDHLEAMGFDRALVLEVFFACNKNEELAANYLLDHMHEFED